MSCNTSVNVVQFHKANGRSLYVLSLCNCCEQFIVCSESYSSRLTFHKQFSSKPVVSHFLCCLYCDGEGSCLFTVSACTHQSSCWTPLTLTAVRHSSPAREDACGITSSRSLISSMLAPEGGMKRWVKGGLFWVLNQRNQQRLKNNQDLELMSQLIIFPNYVRGMLALSLGKMYTI